MRAIFVLGLVSACAGCVGSGSGTAAGTLYVAQCTVSGTPPTTNHPIGSLTSPAAYNLAPTYFVAAPTLDPNLALPMNRVVIREQSENSYLAADTIEFTVADVRLIADQLGQVIEVGPTSNLRAMLTLNHSCLTNSTGLELDGPLTFTRFGSASAGAAAPTDFSIEPGAPLTATFHFDIVDRRALTLGGTGAVPVTPQVGGHLDGSFDFVVRAGPGAQDHP